MKKSNHYYLYFLFSLLFILTGSPSLFAQQKKYSKEIEEKIKQVEQNLASWVQIEGAPKWTLQERMKAYKANGVSIAVIKDYKIEWARSYGWADSAEKRPVNTATRFQAASISKTINSLGILKLAEQGKLDLYADINQYLKRWKFPYDSVSKGKKITAANLLSHTAGLTVHGFPGYKKTDAIPTLIEILDGKKPANTAAVRSAFEPSLKYQYSGGGITILQLLIEDITGMPYDVYMWENVLKPMGMINSSFTQPTRQQDNLATAYNNGTQVKGKYHLYPEQAAAGLWTTPTDLAKYIIETQLALKGKSNKVLSQEMTKLRLTPYIDSTSALGAFIIKKGDDLYFNHGGQNEGFVSQSFGSLNNGNGVVVMTNTVGDIRDEIVNSVARVYNWKGFYTPKIKKLINPSAAVLEKYIGKYTFMTETYAVTKENGGLVFHDGGNKLKMYFTSETEFFIQEISEAEFKFAKDKQNKVDGFEFKQGSFEMKATKTE